MMQLELVFRFLSWNCAREVPPLGDPSALAPCMDDVSEDIKTHSSLVVGLGPVLQVFAEPDPELHTGVQIKRIVKVGEDQLRMLIVYHGHGVPQS